jgi:hypothetical protein
MAKLTLEQKKSIKSYVGLFDVDFVAKFLKKAGYNGVHYWINLKDLPKSPFYPLSYFINNAKKQVLNTKYSSVTFSKNGNVTIKSGKNYFLFF